MKHIILFIIISTALFSCDPPEAKDVYDPSNEESALTVSTYTIDANKTSGNADVDAYYKYWLGFYGKKSRYFDTRGGLYVMADANGDVPADWISAGVESKSQSEAHGYGMLIAALMDDQPVYDGFYKMYKQYPSNQNSNLMSWIIPANEDSDLSKSTCASDGDFDIAYSLVVAHEQWGSNGDINYLAEARRVINQGIKVELISDANRIMQGDWQAHTNDATRSSDWMPGHIRVFDQYDGSSDSTLWNAVIAEIYSCIADVANTATGLVPDFAINEPAIAAPPYHLESDTDDDYSWNACRYPWRIASDYLHYNIDNARVAVKEILDWQNTTDPYAFGKGNGYQLDGTRLDSETWNSAAFVSPFILAAKVDILNHGTLYNNGLSYMNQQKSYDVINYFGESITMLCMLMAHDVWQAPDGDPAN